MTISGSTRPDVFFYEAFEEEALQLKEILGNTCIAQFSSRTIQELGQATPPARLISIRTQSEIPVEWAPSIDGILSRSTGYDHLIAYRSKIRNTLPMGYLDEYATRAVAEQALLLGLALVRKLTVQMKQVATFGRDGLTGGECPGKHLLVVGVGRIGSEICRIGKALGFDVRGVDIVTDKPDVKYVSREEGIPWGDVIICAMNLTKENRGYFTYEMMRKAKPGTILVNIARGEHTPMEILSRLLREKILAGVGLDVYEEEGKLGAALRNPASQESESVAKFRQLAAYPNVILTPHNAFNTMEALRRKSEMSVDQVKYFLRHKDFVWKLG